MSEALTPEQLAAIGARVDRDDVLPWPVTSAATERRREAITDRRALLDEVWRLRRVLNTPEVHDFGRAVVLEALHQRERWSTNGDAGKTPADWFWLIGYLAGKALHAAIAGNAHKALHHTISTAAACANWHAAISGTSTTMRPGTDGRGVTS